VIPSFIFSVASVSATLSEVSEGSSEGVLGGSEKLDVAPPFHQVGILVIGIETVLLVVAGTSLLGVVGVVLPVVVGVSLFGVIGVSFPVVVVGVLSIVVRSVQVEVEVEGVEVSAGFSAVVSR
jgi:hypothetical protein